MASLCLNMTDGDNGGRCLAVITPSRIEYTGSVFRAMKHWPAYAVQSRTHNRSPGGIELNRPRHVKYMLYALLLMIPLPAGAGDSILQDFDGNNAQIEDYAGKGKWLAVMYWASDCHVCNIEAANYADFHRRNIAGRGYDHLSRHTDGDADEHRSNRHQRQQREHRHYGENLNR